MRGHDRASAAAPSRWLWLSLLGLGMIGQGVPYLVTHASDVNRAFLPPDTWSWFESAAQLQRAKEWSGLAWSLCDPAAFAWVLTLGVAVTLERRWGRSRWRWPIRCGFLAGVYVLIWIAGLPFAMFVFLTRQALGLTVASTAGRLLLLVHSAVVPMLLFVLKLLLVYCCFPLFGRRWWPAATVLAALIFVILPESLSLDRPLDGAETLTPLPQGEVRDALERVTARTGRDLDFFVSDQSRRSRMVNMTLTGRLHREYVVMTDTLIQLLSPRELAAILAHELWHHRRRPAVVWTGHAAAVLQMGLVFFLVHRIHRRRPIADPYRLQALILVLLIGAIVGWIANPAYAAVQRREEIAADRHALSLTGDAVALESALIKTSVANSISYDVPRWTYFLAAGHPTLKDRLALIRAWRAAARDAPSGATAPAALAPAMRAWGTPGLSVAVFDARNILWAQGFGVTDHDTGRPVNAGTLFQAASISKAVAAMATLKAAQDGVFGLDDDINSVLTSWKLPENALTAKRPVTPRMLLSHTAGTTVPGFPGYDPRGPVPTVLQVLNGHPPAITPPVVVDTLPFTTYRYSGGGSTVMQLALADALGKPYADIVRDAVLDPLGMRDSTFAQPLPPELRSRAAWGHPSDPRRGAAGGNRVPEWRVYPELAAAGLWTTASDLARFAIEIQQAARGASNKVLNQEFARLMVTPVGVGPHSLGFLTAGSTHEGAAANQADFFFHTGGNSGFRSLLFCHAAEGYGFAILANSDTAGPLILGELPRRLAARYGWEPAELARALSTRPSREIPEIQPPRWIRAAGAFFAVAAAVLTWNLLRAARRSRRRPPP